MLNIIEKINRRSYDYWKKKEEKDPFDAHSLLRDKFNFRPIHPSKNNIFNITQNEITFVNKKEIPLCIIDAEPDYLPVFSFMCEKKQHGKKKPHDNNSQEFWYVSLRLGMIKVKEEIPKGFGFRFESGNPESTHTYYHCQITHDPFKNDRSGEIFKHFQGPPENNPCIVLPVKNPTTLILCFLLSIYGYNSKLWDTYQLNYTKILEEDKEIILQFYNHNSFTLVPV